MEERFTPEMLLDHYMSQRGISVEDIGIGRIVILAWSKTVLRSLAKRHAATLSPHWIYGEQHPLFNGEVVGRKVSFAHLPWGAPSTVTFMEEMVACGAEAFIALGMTGSLQPSAPVGTLLIPTSCVREEGTSRHYVEDGATISPDGALVEALEEAAHAEGANVFSGPLWTTDAPYRELVSKIEAYSRDGVLGVDMETSAMYALGQCRRVRVANLLVVSDELWQLWRPAFGTEELKTAMAQAQGVIERCISSASMLLDKTVS